MDQPQSVFTDHGRPRTVATNVTQRALSTPLYSQPSATKPPLRVGVLLNDWTVSAWVGDVLANVQDSGIAVLTTVILNREPRPEEKKSPGKLNPLRSENLRFGSVLWNRYVRTDQRRNPVLATTFQAIDLHVLLHGKRTIDVVPVRTGSVHLFNDADITLIKRDRLDVILKFGFNVLTGDILSAARYGVWFYHHGGTEDDYGTPAAFWEMYEGNPLTAGTLQIMRADPDGPKVIYRSFGATQSFESWIENRYWLHRKAVPFVTRCLRRVYEHGTAGIRSEAPVWTPRHDRPPLNRHILLFLLRTQWRHLVVRIQDQLQIQRDHMFIAIARGVAPGRPLGGKVATLHPPRGRFWADPMIVRSAGQAFMFFEDYDYSLGRGLISVAELDAGGRMGRPRTALKADHHLSYPFVFEWQGAHYMVPESASVRAVQLYRCVGFPTRWEYVKDLLHDITAVDATLCEHDGHWYLFTAVSEAGGSTWDELFLFVAKTPLGPWAPHPMNPIVSDVRSARPGGPLFRYKKRLYRPGQNSAKCYGHSLAIQEVTELTPERYAERLVYRIEPDWLPGIYGCHTITMDGNLMALDCKALKWRA